jgi:hypothetical protein
MRHCISIATALIMLASVPALALNPGTDILVPAAGRAEPWRTDLYVMNPGSSTVTVTVSWLVRDQPNPSPDSFTLSLGPGRTEIFEDIILEEFGFAGGDNANGAFRVVADGEVVVNSRIYADDGSQTFGQGFEGVPTWAATGAGQSTDVVGLTQGFGFRTNVYATAGPEGATIDFTLVSTGGSAIATATLGLDSYEPYLTRINRLFSGLANFENATLSAEVSSGLAVIGASKVDDASTDPTTLESAASGGTGPVDGTYEFVLYESTNFPGGGGGALVITDGSVDVINGSYFNFENDDDGDGEPDCLWVFPWGQDFPLSPGVPVEEFASGYSYEDTFDDTEGVMEWTLQFTVDNNMALTGVMSAVGSGFPAEDSGCNGDFPPLDFRAGKAN